MPKLQVTSTSSPPSSFPQFTRLPPELRMMIWEEAMDEPRTIHIFHVPENYTQRTLTINNVKFIDVPVFFFVNQECREIAVKQYTEIKGTLRISRPSVLLCRNSKLLNLNFHMKKGNRLQFHNCIPFGSESSPEPQHVSVRRESYFFNCDLPQFNRWVESLPSDYNKAEATGFLCERTCWERMTQQQGSLYVAFWEWVLDNSIGLCLVDDRDEVSKR
ncbi:hypothetical protein F4824DRAFT_474706 [Ustulina deusta]|nr:hypothetical protein F4824DRAFT_474706 [Ustulina deusta]